jgi:glycosyltransferase involved in cell wall biosynthesis
MTRPPTVSVIIPTRDREALLRQAVESVLAQTYGDWELIVADDGSTDGTREYLEGCADERVRPLFLGQGRNSPCRGRNAGLRRARGDWVAFLDDDDLWLPEKLALQLARLQAEPRCGWSYTGFEHIDAEGRPRAAHPSSGFHPISGRILEPLLTFAAVAVICTLMVRRSLLDEVGGFDEHVALREDYDLVLRLAARSDVCAVPETLTLVRVHDGRSTTRRRAADLFELNERVYRKAAAAAPTDAIRALCIRRCAAERARRAYVLSDEGAHREALVAVGRALRDAPLAYDVWRTAARTAARALGWRGVASRAAASRDEQEERARSGE